MNETSASPNRPSQFDTSQWKASGTQERPGMDAQLVQELEECYQAYQKVKEKTDAMAAEGGVSPELIESMKRAAEQHLKDCIQERMMRHTSGNSAPKAEAPPKQEEPPQPDEQPTEETNQKTESNPKHTIKKLYRSTGDSKFAGICGGLAEYFEVDSNIIRIIFVVSAIPWPPFFSIGIFTYLALLLILSEKEWS